MPDTEIEGVEESHGRRMCFILPMPTSATTRYCQCERLRQLECHSTSTYLHEHERQLLLSGGRVKACRNDGWSLFAYGGAQQTLPHDWRISLNVFGQTPWIMLQGKGSSFFDYGLSVNKSFLDKRLTLSAFASNFFKKYMDQAPHRGSGFIRESNYKYSRQRFGISVSYRIGELKANVKKAARTISNDDVKSGGSGSGGGVNSCKYIPSETCTSLFIREYKFQKGIFYDSKLLADC